MKPFTQHTGIAVPLDRANVDTDAIIPKQFLKKVDKEGLGRFLFFDWRYEAGDTAKPNEVFVLNQEPYRQATILVARENFGCGSSREHAPWALADFGFRAILAPSFAEIFFNNCFKNGLLPIVLKKEEIQGIFENIAQTKGLRLTVDLKAQTVQSGKDVFRFAVNDFTKECLLKGLDGIGWTLQHIDEIGAFEEKQKNAQPWLWEM